MNAILLISFLFAHFMGDYSHLSTPKMLAAKRIGKPYTPIAEHALVHTWFFSFITLIYQNHTHYNTIIFASIVLIEFMSHFLIDTLKGKCNVWFPKVSTPSNTIHWYIFGFDQLLHQLIIVWIWYLLTKA